MNKIVPFPGEKPDIKEMTLDGKREKAIAWVKSTFARYVQDQAALIHYMMD